MNSGCRRAAPGDTVRILAMGYAATREAIRAGKKFLAILATLDEPITALQCAVVLEELRRYDAAVAYQRCIELDPTHADVHLNLARLSEIRCDEQGLVRHLGAYRRLVG
ncbi:tetratricopeptide repeat protein [Paraburkholderia sp. BL27I4N3]|uniref:tetratricopeptide repeat protein n=1 Tax=Paraburkholderia sp. BL27I4N3 TaxID=1938805 RepID=UPI003857BB89